MREIKFRVWHIAKKDAYEIKMKKSHMIYFDFDDYADDHDGEYGSGNIDLKTKPLMQYTGLKDKNGKEIYEGDIVKYGNEGMYKSIIQYERWEDDNYGNYIGFIHYGEENMEIIGNICENPELITNPHP